MTLEQIVKEVLIATVADDDLFDRILDGCKIEKLKPEHLKSPVARLAAYLETCRVNPIPSIGEIVMSQNFDFAVQCHDSLKESMLEALLKELHCIELVQVAAPQDEDDEDVVAFELGADVTAAAVHAQSALCDRIKSTLAYAELLAGLFCGAGSASVFCQRVQVALGIAKSLAASFCGTATSDAECV